MSKLVLMLILKFLSACFVVFFSNHSILVLSASEEWSVLHLLEQPFAPEIAKFIQGALEESPNQTESYLMAAIEVNNSKAAKYIIEHANQGQVLRDLIKTIYERSSLVVPDEQVAEPNSLKVTNLVSKITISAIDLGYFLGLEGLIKFLAEWKLRDSHESVKPIEGNENELISMLIEEILDMNAKNDYGESLLHAACRWKKLELVKFLLARGEKYRTKMVVSVLLGDEVFYKKVVSNAIADINSLNNDGMTPLHCACCFGSVELVVLLLEMPEINLNIQDKCGNTPIMKAVQQKKCDIVNILLARQALDVNVGDAYGNTLLHLACTGGQLEIVEKLLATRQVDVNKETKFGSSPIKLASWYGKQDIVDYLLTRQELNTNEKHEYSNNSLYIVF